MSGVSNEVAQTVLAGLILACGLGAIIGQFVWPLRKQ